MNCINKCYFNLTRLYVIEAISTALRQVISRRKSEATIHCIRALPLYHFLKEDSTPNTVIQTGNKVVWGDPGILLGTLKASLEESKSE